MKRGLTLALALLISAPAQAQTPPQNIEGADVSAPVSADLGAYFAHARIRRDRRYFYVEAFGSVQPYHAVSAPHELPPAALCMRDMARVFYDTDAERFPGPPASALPGSVSSVRTTQVFRIARPNLGAALTQSAVDEACAKLDADVAGWTPMPERIFSLDRFVHGVWLASGLVSTLQARRHSFAGLDLDALRAANPHGVEALTRHNPLLIASVRCTAPSVAAVCTSMTVEFECGLSIDFDTHVDSGPDIAVASFVRAEIHTEDDCIVLTGE